MTSSYAPAAAAITQKGWPKAHGWLLARRMTQISFLLLFLAGPWFGLWIVKGDMAASRTLDVLPLTDPYILLQSFFAGHIPETTALIGAAIVAGVYALIGGRVYCAWVCPLNMVTDAAHWLREKLGLTKGWPPKRELRLWILGMTLAVSAVGGTIAWELVNPVTMIYRGLVFSLGAVTVVIVALFLFDVFVSRRGWCGNLCPVGALYALVGVKAVLRVSARNRHDCDDCMDCYAVCPEPQVITPALKGLAKDASPLILDRDCSNCGRCMDVCAKDVFCFTSRFHEPPLPYPVTNAPRKAA
ncbi:MAG: quinol dehydrogenase ferredoxin subunit NapH [Alphaproteobacteria bacterium]|nr:quinol dehydrogenase ferredoxin subunit NapH [Alphaproteobacteria bacterium]